MRAMRAVRGLSALARGLVGALLPAQCAGCRAWDEVLCQSCRCLVGGPARLASLDGARGPIPLAAVGDYSGPLRRIVLTAKHSSRTDVTDVLHEAGAVLGTALAQVLAQPAVHEQLTTLGLTVGHMAPGQLAARQKAYTAAWARIIRNSGFTAQ